MMATKYGRASALNWSDEFTGQILPNIIQELGGSSSGTAFMSMYPGADRRPDDAALDQGLGPARTGATLTTR